MLDAGCSPSKSKSSAAGPARMAAATLGQDANGRAPMAPVRPPEDDPPSADGFIPGVGPSSKGLLPLHRYIVCFK